MKYEIEMQACFVPLPVDRQESHKRVLIEIYSQALAEVRNGIGDPDRNGDDEFDFGC